MKISYQKILSGLDVVFVMKNGVFHQLLIKNENKILFTIILELLTWKIKKHRFNDDNQKNN